MKKLSKVRNNHSGDFLRGFAVCACLAFIFLAGCDMPTSSQEPVVVYFLFADERSLGR